MMGQRGVSRWPSHGDETAGRKAKGHGAFLCADGYLVTSNGVVRAGTKMGTCHHGQVSRCYRSGAAFAQSPFSGAMKHDRPSATNRSASKRLAFKAEPKYCGKTTKLGRFVK